MQGPVFIGDNCSLNRGVKLIGPVILGSGCTVFEDVVIQESIVWKKVTFGPKTVVVNSLVANDCYFDADCSAEKAVIGDHIRISSKTKLGPGSRLWPADK
jgi:NDP-sugar pyrophosphorylase family protein